MILNVKISFVYGWFSYRNIKVFTDDNFCTSINANGDHTIEIPNDTRQIRFQLGTVYPYKTVVSLTPNDYKEEKIFVGLNLNHRGILLSLYDSLKTDYLRSRKLSIEEFRLFSENINQKDLIILKNSKTSLLMLLLSLVILVFSVAQQNNNLAPFAFLIGLSSLITSIVYYKEQKVERNNYKVRIISSVSLFILSIYFLDNSYLFLHWIILGFTTLLILFFIENLKSNQNIDVKEV